MDAGAYGSYPRRRNKRSFKRRANYRKRVNPINQFSYKKTRVGKYFKTDQQSVMCTNKSVIFQENGGNGEYLSTLSGFDFLNLTTILANSSEFISRQVQYSYYKLNGMKVILTRRWIDPVLLGVTDTTPGWLSLSQGLPKLSINFYPNIQSTTVGQSVANADSSFDFSPYLSREQSHYIPFPKDFTTGSNSQGLGVWNACNSYSTISGELALWSAPTQMRPSNVENMFIWDMEVEVYAQFCNNLGN